VKFIVVPLDIAKSFVISGDYTIYKTITSSGEIWYTSISSIDNGLFRVCYILNSDLKKTQQFDKSSFYQKYKTSTLPKSISISEKNVKTTKSKRVNSDEMHIISFEKSPTTVISNPIRESNIFS
jgi:hypothetical protein